jgi:hypothetical protein
VARALTQDFALVHPDMPIDAQDPKCFYEGFDTGWGGIAQSLDVRLR